MNQKELNEIRRRFRLDKNNFSRIFGCYVNSNREDSSVSGALSKPVAITVTRISSSMVSSNVAPKIVRASG